MITGTLRQTEIAARRFCGSAYLMPFRYSVNVKISCLPNIRKYEKINSSQDKRNVYIAAAANPGIASGNNILKNV
jgi:hypothetical protein